MARGSNPDQNPTLRGRRLALELLHRRESTGMTREEVARQLEWSTSTLFRIETGRSLPQPGNVRVLLELYGVTGPERDGLIQLARDARQPGWWHSFRDVLPNPYEVYIGLEAGAASIRNFEPVRGARAAPDRGLHPRDDPQRAARTRPRRGRAPRRSPHGPSEDPDPRRSAAAVGGRSTKPSSTASSAALRSCEGNSGTWSSLPSRARPPFRSSLPCRRTRRNDRPVRHPGLPRAHRPRRGVRRDPGRGHLPRGAFGREPLYPCI